MRAFLDAPRNHERVKLCDCGRLATANGRECSVCFLGRLRSVNSGFAPTRTLGRGKMLGSDQARHWENRLEDYRKVRKEGSQPAGTTRRDIDLAKRASDIAGAAVDAGPYSRMEVGV